MNANLPARNRRGSALLSVLAVLLLLTTLVVGLLLRANFEHGSSASYRAASNTRSLTDATVNLVQAQINEATTLPPTQAWASQPGAIRTFDDSGALQKIYRLYSSAAVKPDATSGSVLQNDLPPATWAASPALWVDLNAPAYVRQSDGKFNYQFPILDPRDPASPGAADSDGTNAKPSVIASTQLKGFYLGKIPGYTGAAGTSGATDVPGATDSQPIPMPVQWLYVLEDGKIVAPGSGSTGQTATIPGASEANPIVGRIAYWTDDESTKVNINTAAGNARGDGTYAPWETPHFRILDEVNMFAKSIPAHYEYQRYSGHPATTNLYDILDGLHFNTGKAAGAYPAAGNGTPSPFFKILPRYNDDYGSEQGTKVNTGSTTIANVSPTLKTQRLFPSLAELLYSPDRTVTDPTLARQTLETGKFFLTAQSRAPDVTLFGTPRVSMWPIDADLYTTGVTSTRASTFDRVIAFCSSAGTASPGKKFPYYIQRSRSYDPRYDWDSIPRNQQLFAYLKNLTNMTIPGVIGGSTLAGKYNVSNEWDQILTEVVDYIRSTNVYDYNLAGGKQYTPGYFTYGAGQVVPLKIRQNNIDTRGLGRMYTLGEVSLLIICTADGNGTDPNANGSANDWRTVSNIAVPRKLKDASGNLVGEDYATPSLPTSPDFAANDTLKTAYSDSVGVALNPGQKRYQAMLLLDLNCPAMGSSAIWPSFKINVKGLGSLAFTDVGGASAIPFPSTSDGVLIPALSRLNYTFNLGGSLGFRWPIGNGTGTARVNGWSNQTQGAIRYPYVSNPFTLPGAATGSRFGITGQITVEFYVPPTGGSPALESVPTITSDTKVQTFTLSFPATTVPAPDLLQHGLVTNFGTAAIASVASDWWGFDNRIKWIGSGPSDYASRQAQGSVIRVDSVTVPATGLLPIPNWKKKDGATATPATATSAAAIPFRDYATATNYASDTVVSLVPLDMDTRLTVAKESVQGLDFGAHPLYGTKKLAHSLREFGNPVNTVGGDTGGRLAASVTYDAAIAPKVPSVGFPANVSTQGDWDSGWPTCPDGAYANKADEGNISSNAVPYYGSIETQTQTVKYFSPNRIIPSAVMLGSLPTGVMENISWRTLCFRPQMNRPRDPAVAGPKDYMLLDLFNMPIVEPYAISEPFSTAGRINMNYAIAPFSYITRDTGVRAVLSSVMLAKVPSSAGASYKGSTSTPPTATSPARFPVKMSEVDGSLRQFQERFAAGDIFRSAAEICSIYLVPDASIGNTYSWTSNLQADNAWYNPTGDFALLGDNVRERPYADIYPRLTTKSNTFKVHYTVQALKNPKSNPGGAGAWDVRYGQVEGEFRGSTIIERFIDPDHPDIKDYATKPSLYTPGSADCKTLDNFYQWRVISNTAFPQ